MLTSVLVLACFVGFFFAHTETHTFCKRGGKKQQKKISKEVKVSPGLLMGRGITQGVTPALPPLTGSCVTARPVEPAALLSAFAEHLTSPLATATGLLPAAKPAPTFSS